MAVSKIEKIQSILQKHETRLEKILAKRENSIEGQLRDARAKDRKALEERNGSYSMAALNEELAQRGAFLGHSLSAGLDESGNFSWEVWEKETLRRLNSDYDFDIRLLRESITSKERELEQAMKTGAHNNELATRKERELENSKKWVEDFPVPEELNKFLDSYEEFIRGEFQKMEIEESKIEKMVQESIQDLLIDLSYRISEKTGKLLDAYGIHCNGKTLEGYFKGEKRTVGLRMIMAGGYNKQRLHNRILVL